LTPRRHTQLIAGVLIAALLLGSMPLAESTIIGENESVPAFTLDICHPLPVFAVDAASCTLAAFTAFSYSVTIEDYGATEASNFAVADRASEAPDPPPPKPLA
jgi:hypothetical protein